MANENQKVSLNSGLPIQNLHAAGIDIGDTKHDIAILDKSGNHIVREYGTFTRDLRDIIDWLLCNQITTVAIESTGIYWLNLFLMLEEAGIEPYLVNAKFAKNVTGRKKDDTDAIWLQKLHSCGLLQKSFQPEGDYRVLRTYVRQRKKALQLGSDSVRRMQKALELMNIKIHTVISDILGKTGMLIVRAILSGERKPENFLQYKDRRIKASDSEFVLAMEGLWKEEYIFTLQQAHDAYVFYQKQAKACDERIAEILTNQAAKVLDGDITDVPYGIKKGAPKKNQYNFHAQKLLHIIVGVDLCKIDGMSEISAVELISEVGVDLSKWKSCKHFAAWLNLVPNTRITGGKIISSRMQKRKNTAGRTLRQAASNMSKSKSALGDYSRRIRSKIGKKGAVVASAHKLSKIIYTMIVSQREYDQTVLIEQQDKWKERRIRHLERQLDQIKNAS